MIDAEKKKSMSYTLRLPAPLHARLKQVSAAVSIPACRLISVFLSQRQEEFSEWVEGMLKAAQEK